MKDLIKTFLGLLLLVSSALHALNDPTRPKFQAFELEGNNPYGFNLQSILLSKNRRLALVNGHYYQERDVVVQNKIIKIREESVVILHNGEEKTVYLFDDVKRIVNK